MLLVEERLLVEMEPLANRALILRMLVNALIETDICLYTTYTFSEPPVVWRLDFVSISCFKSLLSAWRTHTKPSIHVWRNFNPAAHETRTKKLEVVNVSTNTLLIWCCFNFGTVHQTTIFLSWLKRYRAAAIFTCTYVWNVCWVWASGFVSFCFFSTLLYW